MKKLFLPLFAVLLLMMSACNKNTDSGTSTGTMKLYMADGPMEDTNVAAVYITVEKISVNVNNTWQDLAGFKGPEKFNLFDLHDSNNVFLGQSVLPAGSYSEIRFILDAPDENSSPQSNPACFILNKDGSEIPLFVPSGSSSGFKAKGDFDVPANGTVTLLSDFDLRKSIVSSGNSGKTILKPVIRLQAVNQAGSVAGTFSDSGVYHSFVVYAYPTGSYTDAQSANPATGALRFPDAINSTMVHPGDLQYRLENLSAGSYNLLETELDANGNYVKVLGYVNNVNVVSGKTTTLDINTKSLSSTH
jgi:hypothetical protein